MTSEASFPASDAPSWAGGQLLAEQEAHELLAGQPQPDGERVTEEKAKRNPAP